MNQKYEALMVVTVDDLEKGFRTAGLAQGDRIMVHSSLSSFGRVEGGAETVIEALMRIVGLDGTIIMPTFTLTFFNAEPRVFDLLKTPSEMGKITETFRRRPDTVRSKHMTHSVSVWGKNAADIVALRSKTAWGTDGTFQWLLDHNAKILLLGVDYNRCTLIHKSEESMRVPYRHFVTFGGETILPDGSREPNDSEVYVRLPGLDNDWTDLIKILDTPDVTHQVRVGESTVRLARAGAIFSEAVKMVRTNKLALLSEESRVRFMLMKRS
jgi:aminoglycoside 3-N-acetyltransferase